VPALVTRSGYTGEDGFEIAVPRAQAETLARRLLAHPDVRPVGLGARDTLRLEAGLPLHGQDMDESTRPAESGLAWAIARSRRSGAARAGGFPGAERVLREERAGTSRVLEGFMGVESAPIRAGASLVRADGRAVGTVTSGTVSPTLGQPILLARIEAGIAPDTSLDALVRGQPRPVRRIALPFVAKRYKRSA
jgi:aminomethyltransferase